MLSSKHSLTLSLILLILLIVIAGCGGVSTSKPTSSAASQGLFRVALVLQGPLQDTTWNKPAYDGLKIIEKEFGAQIAYSENVPTSDAAQVFRKYATEGFDFVIAHSTEYVAPIGTVALDFPRTKFAVVGSYQGNNKNLGALAFREDEMGYLLGAVAAVKTQTNKVAYIGSIQTPPLQESSDAFARGAKATNPVVQTSIQWIGSWWAPDTAKKIAQDLIGQGTDVIVLNTSGSDQAITEVAKSARVYTIGFGQDTSGSAQGTVLTSAIQRIPVLILRGTTLVREGRWEGKQFKFGMKEGTQELMSFNGTLTADQEKRVNDIRDQILLAKINVSR